MRMVLNLDRFPLVPSPFHRSSIAAAVVVATTGPVVLQAQTPASNASGTDAAAFTAGIRGTSVESTASPTAPPTVSVERTAFLMGTRATVRVEAGERQIALDASEKALDAISGMEDLLSTWVDDTELARLNRAAPGRAVGPAPAVADLLREVAGWSRRTSGAFHPGVGSLIDAWDLRGRGRVPSPEELRRARAAAGEAGVSIDPRSGDVVRMDADAWLDTGAFGKGAALREARRALLATGIPSARIDLGGQLLLIGDTPATVSVAHPVHRSRRLYDLTVADASVATSGQSERGIDVDGVRYGHLLDPRSGRPVPAWGSVTVVHRDPMVADILATALFVLGPDDGMELARSLEVAALFLSTDTDGVLGRMTPAMGRLDPVCSDEASHSDAPFCGLSDPLEP